MNLHLLERPNPNVLHTPKLPPSDLLKFGEWYQVPGIEVLWVSRVFQYKFIDRVHSSTRTQPQFPKNPMPALYRGCLLLSPGRRPGVRGTITFTNKETEA